MNAIKAAIEQEFNGIRWEWGDPTGDFQGKALGGMLSFNAVVGGNYTIMNIVCLPLSFVSYSNVSRMENDLSPVANLPLIEAVRKLVRPIKQKIGM